MFVPVHVVKMLNYVLMMNNCILYSIVDTVVCYATVSYSIHCSDYHWQTNNNKSNVLPEECICDQLQILRELRQRDYCVVSEIYKSH